jgi:hypothetical protein
MSISYPNYNNNSFYEIEFINEKYINEFILDNHKINIIRLIMMLRLVQFIIIIFRRL